MKHRASSFLLLSLSVLLLQSCAITGFEKRLHRPGFHISFDQRNKGLRIDESHDMGNTATEALASESMVTASVRNEGSTALMASQPGTVDLFNVGGIAAHSSLYESLPLAMEDTSHHERVLLKTILATGGLAALSGTAMLVLDVAHINQQETFEGRGPELVPFILSTGIITILFSVLAFIFIKKLKRKGKPQSKTWRIGMAMAIIGFGLVGLSLITLIYYTLFALFRIVSN